MLPYVCVPRIQFLTTERPLLLAVLLVEVPDAGVMRRGVTPVWRVPLAADAANCWMLLVVLALAGVFWEENVVGATDTRRAEEEGATGAEETAVCCVTLSFLREVFLLLLFFFLFAIS